MAERSKFQQNIIKNYYENFDTLQLQRLGELVTELYLATGKKRQQHWKSVVLHLEKQGYVSRTPDPRDRRAKLVTPTARGREVMGIAQALVPELEQRLSQLLGTDRVQCLRTDLETILGAEIALR